SKEHDQNVRTPFEPRSSSSSSASSIRACAFAEPVTPADSANPEERLAQEHIGFAAGEEESGEKGIGTIAGEQRPAEAETEAEKVGPTAGDRAMSKRPLFIRYRGEA